MAVVWSCHLYVERPLREQLVRVVDSSSGSSSSSCSGSGRGGGDGLSRKKSSR